MRMKELLVVMSLVCLLFGERTCAQADSDFKQIVASADAVVIAKVEKVASVGDIKVALATVLDGVRGLKDGQKIAYLADRASLGDDSFAVVGETVLLCLVKYPPDYGADKTFFEQDHPLFRLDQKRLLGDRPFYRIAAQGFGRLAVIRSDNKNYVFAPIGLPTSVPLTPFPHAFGTEAHLVRITELIKLVKQIGKHASPLPTAAGKGQTVVR